MNVTKYLVIYASKTSFVSTHNGEISKGIETYFYQIKIHQFISVEMLENFVYESSRKPSIYFDQTMTLLMMKNGIKTGNVHSIMVSAHIQRSLSGFLTVTKYKVWC